MLRSLSSSISGLQNHQTRMDIIGNNIANVNTVGYKAGRVTFEESFSQLLQGASRPPGNGGGTNPLQVGLGMSVGSVDTLHTQGNLQATGRILDLAIEGDSFFAVSDGKGTYYTRNGGFQLDANGNIVLPTNGMVLQGKMADAQGNFPAGTVIGNIRVPFNEQSPAKVTENVHFSRNLDSEAYAKGTVTYTQRFLHHTETGDNVRSLFSGKGADLGIKDGDRITISAYVGSPAPANYMEATYIVGVDINTIDDLVTHIANLTGSTVSLTASGLYAGALEIVPTSDVYNLQVTSDNPLSNPYLNKALNVPSRMMTGGTYYTDTLRSPAEETDLLSELYDANGDALGLEDGDIIDVTAMVGKDSVNSAESGLSISYVAGPGGTTMADLMTMVRDTLKLPTTDGTVLNNPTVSMNLGATEDGIPDGALVVRGAKGLDFAINNLTIRATNANSQNPAPTLFNANTAFTEKQKAQDVGVFDTSITVYDDTGEEHVLTMTFVHTGVPGEWDWSVRFNGRETITQGSRGRITFGQDGSVAAFTYDDNSSQLVVDPNNGSSLMRLNLNVGGPGNFQGITQFSSPTTVSAVKQDGYTTGSLVDLSIDEFGYISGAFSNGTNRRLAQIMLVDFTNPGGLLKVSDSVFTISANSGDPIFGAPGTQSSSRIKPGALEMSNVDLATEFTSMITTQRGYQANARVITVSDTMLEELVALKR